MSYATGKDMLLMPDGSTYHLGTKKGDIHPRILTVGSMGRAEAISKHLDEGTVKYQTCPRQFHIYSGTFKGVGVTIIAIGMGAPMMDFMVREALYTLESPLAIIRLGTCGLFNKELPPGTVVCAGKGSKYVNINYCHWNGSKNSCDACGQSISGCSAMKPYLICDSVPCDVELNKLLLEKFKDADVDVRDGLNACAETFYGCQGRIDPNFDDKNQEIVPALVASGVDFVEMETHQLFHLANICKKPLYVAGCAIGIVNRVNDQIKANISSEKMHDMEKIAGRACLEALITFKKV